MVRTLIGFLIQLASNALGLIVAAVILDEMEISGPAFLIAVVIFTVVYAVAQPFFTQLALGQATALRGGVALLATLIALIVTHLLSDGLDISGTLTWIEATFIVWVVSLLGALLLPLIFVKNKAQDRRAR